MSTTGDLNLTAEQIERLDVGVLVCRLTDERWQVEAANPAYLSALPESVRADIVGGSLTAYLPSSVAREVEHYLTEARTHGSAFCPSMRITYADGTTRWYRWTAVADVADPTRVSCLVVDVTAAEQLAETRRGLLERELAAVDRAREELAEELHDGLLQSLTELRLRLEMDDPTVSDVVERAMAEARALMSRLRPPDTSAGVSPAVEQLASEWQAAGLLEVEFKGPRLPSLGTDRDPLLFSIERELLVNAMQHAPNSPVTVEREVSDDRIRITVTDKGPGLSRSAREQARERGHLGLVLCEERIVELGGTMDIRAAHETGGTTVVLELPR